jgi:hypothetical protein
MFGRQARTKGSLSCKRIGLKYDLQILIRLLLFIA